MPRRSHTPEQQSALRKRQVGPEQQELQSAQAATQARAFQCSRWKFKCRTGTFFVSWKFCPNTPLGSVLISRSTSMPSQKACCWRSEWKVAQSNNMRINPTLQQEKMQLKSILVIEPGILPFFFYYCYCFSIIFTNFTQVWILKSVWDSVLFTKSLFSPELFASSFYILYQTNTNQTGF